MYFCHSQCHGDRWALHDKHQVGTSYAVHLMDTTEQCYVNTIQINGVHCDCIFVCKATTERERLDLRRDSMGVWEEGKRFTKMPWKGKQKATKEDSFKCGDYF